MPLIHDESGQTLPELLIATVIGLIVVFAAFLMLQTSLTQSNRISQREDATQHGRLAMEQITRELRAQVCIDGATPSISAGSGTSVTFTNDLSGGVNPPIQRTITYVPPPTAPANLPGKIVETQVAGVGFPPNTKFTGGSTVVTVLQNVVPIPSVPVFQYYQFDTSGAPGLSASPMAVPLDVVREAQAVDIKVSFLVRGTSSPNGNPDALGSSFQDDVYTRVADPTAPKLGTNCS